MVFIVALYVPWCRRLESLPFVRPQLFADNLKCSSVCPGALFDAAWFTVQYVRSVGQDVSPGECVILSTSKAVRKSMKLQDASGVLGGHLDFTKRARAGTLSKRVKDATHGVVVARLPG